MSNLNPRGKFTLTVLTLDAARLAGVPFRPGATLWGELRFDGDSPFYVAWRDVAMARGFISDTEPRRITVKGAPFEDCSQLQTALREGVHGPVH